MMHWAKPASERNQVVLFAPTLDDAIPHDHPVRLFEEVLAELDFSSWEAAYGRVRGQPPIHPRVVAGVILYGLSLGIRSSRRLEEATANRLDFIWLCGGRVIDHATFAKFRVKFGDLIRGLFREVAKVAVGMGLANLNQIVFDGTAKRSSNSRHKTLGRSGLQRAMAEVDKQVDQMMGQWEAADGREKALFGESSASRLPRDLGDLVKRQARLREAMKRLEAMEAKSPGGKRSVAAAAKAAAAKASEKSKPVGEASIPVGNNDCDDADAGKVVASVDSPPVDCGDAASADSAPADVAPAVGKSGKSRGPRVPITDPDSSVAKNKTGGFAPNYTAILGTEGKNGFIVDVQLQGGCDEPASVIPAVKAVEEAFGSRPAEVLADSNFNSAANLRDLDELGVVAMMPPRQPPARENPAIRTDPTQPVPADQHAKLPVNPQMKVLDRSAFVYDAQADCYHCPMGRVLKYAGDHAYVRMSIRGKHRVYEADREYCGACELAGRCLPGKVVQRRVVRDEQEPLREQMAERMSDEEGKKRYRRRSHLAETPFAVMNTTMQFRQFLLRGLEKATTELMWVCGSMNLTKLVRLIARSRAPAPA